MILNYNPQKFVEKRSIRFGLIIYFWILFQISIAILTDAANGFYVSKFVISTQSLDRLNFPSFNYIDFFLFPIILTGSTIVISLPFGLFSKNIPYSIDHFIKSDALIVQLRKDKEFFNDYCVISLNGAVIEISWNKCYGSYHQWKIEISLIISPELIKEKSKYEQYAKLMIMRKDKYEPLRYLKIVNVREWPKQDYLIQFWLNYLAIEY